MFAILTLRYSLKNYESLIALLVKVKQSCLIVHSVAIVGCWPYSDQFLVEPINVAFLNKLMGSDNQVNSIK